MGFHGVVRVTEDVDLFIRATPENVERLRSALRAAYDDDPHVADITVPDVLGEHPAKFRSGEAMNAAPPLRRHEGFERFVRHCARYWAIAPRSYPRGVMKFRTLDEAQAAREAHTAKSSR